MSASTQTIVALGLVALAAALLVRIFLQRRKQPGCGADCSAVSPEIKKLQAKLRQ
jgi:MYXO-CTERM domain-containing protein